MTGPEKLKAKTENRGSLFFCFPFVKVIVIMLVLGMKSVMSAEGNAPKPVLVHYMPWYASKPVSDVWGWHWTMGHFDPAQVGSDGQRAVASHDYPLIGLYDSNDPDVLECHVLLIKLAGINGVVIDWYGIDRFRDYAENHRNTQHLIKYIKQAGLKFAICYEDQTVKHMVENKVLKKEEAVAQGKKVFKWLDEHWFQDDAYVKIAGQPVLLVFGPQYFKKDQWSEMKIGLSNPPLLYGLPHLAKPVGADGMFGWPPVSDGQAVAPAIWKKYLRDLYSRAPDESVIAAAFPGFHDIYQEAKLHKSYGSIAARDGKTLKETLELAEQSQAALIQIATWNDYGEGTVIEPVRKRGYQYLEIVQKFMQSRSEDAVAFRAEDLRLPVKLYALKKQYQNDTQAMSNLKRATDLLFSGKCDAARSILETYPAKGR